MKRLEKILVNIVGTLVALYAALVLTFSLPYMQSRLAGWMASVLSKQVGSNVEIGSANLGLLNRVILNDVTIDEPAGERIAHIARISASIDLAALTTGRIDIGTAQLFGVHARLWKETPDSPLNIQFLIDAFKSKDEKEPSELDLRIGSFIMRHANVSYDVRSEPDVPGTLDVNHLDLQDCGMNVALKCLTDDSLHCIVRRLQATDRHSGLGVDDTQLHIEGNKEKVTLSKVHLELPHSFLDLDSLQLTYGYFAADSTFQVSATPLRGEILPCDLAPILKPLASWYKPIRFNVHVEGDQDNVALKECRLNTPQDSLLIDITGNVHYPLNPNRRRVHADINDVRLGGNVLQDIADMVHPGHGQEELLRAVNSLSYQGTADIDGRGEAKSSGKLHTGVGQVRYDMTYNGDKQVTASIDGDSIKLGTLLQDPQLGQTSFHVDADVDVAQSSALPHGSLQGTVSTISYKGHAYRNVQLDVNSSASGLEGMVNVNDTDVKGETAFIYTAGHDKDLQFSILLDEFWPHRLNLISDHAEENLSLTASGHLYGTDISHIYGELNLSDLNIATPETTYSVPRLSIESTLLDGEDSRYTIDSDIVSGSIEGQVAFPDIVTGITNQIAVHLPSLVAPKDATPSSFVYDLTVKDAPILHHFIDTDFELVKPLHLQGKLNSTEQQMDITLSAPQVEYGGKTYDDIAIICNSTERNLNFHALASYNEESDDIDVPSSSMIADVTADVHDDRIFSDLYINLQGRTSLILQLLPVVQFSDSLGHLKTDITMRESTAVLGDTAWIMSPSTISYYQNAIDCHNVQFASKSGKSRLVLDGRASSSPTDALVAKLHNLEIKYILSFIDFDAVRFAGRASGQATVGGVLGGGTPDLHARLSVEDLSIQEGVLGSADIEAHWDEELEGIAVDGRIVDLYAVPDGLTGLSKNMTGVTTVNGWISPAKNDLKLDIFTHNTNVSFINGFLGMVFKEASGYVNGPLSVIGPLNDVNIVGDVVPNMNMRLRATNVPYHIEGDTLRLRKYLFDFRDISLYDRFGHRSTLNGQVTHRNMKDFTYRFQADLHEMLAYDEREFNSDKFLATVFTDGTLTIDGSDGHPLYVDASVTPTRGSVFAYDAATPDAIMGNTFIEFRDRDSLSLIASASTPLPSASKSEKDSLAIVREARRNYNSDIFINFDINLTPACEVKLRMDNIDDGYMRTFGNAKLTAQWYNKGSFQLFGNYNITSGSYRLYLQDIIFRDLALQPGSEVEFNGNPFDANIHLICHHTINAVPLSDLTNTTAFSKNNKVKVICVLDITGKLGNMDFKFDMQMPNVSEETRQLVRSIINSEEEMNTQMIYLLGLGRFYPNQYARANGNDNSSQAVNSLLSSTLSGQINQMLSNMMGTDSKWNFGSSLSTGERGWQDLDVEGILEGRLLNERLLINGNFGYRDNALTNHANFIGDFEVKWRMTPTGNLFVKAYNQTNDRYFTKATLNTQGIGLTWQHNFEIVRQRLKQKSSSETQ